MNIKNGQDTYISPQMEVVEIKARKMLCASTQKSFGIDDDQGYEETSW